MTETTRETLAAEVRWAQARQERRAQERMSFEKCALCGYARINVRHVRDREHAPEGLAYFADVPFCEFRPSGERVYYP